MASKTLIHAVYDFHHRQVFPQVKDYLQFHAFDQKSRDTFNAMLLRKLEKSEARKIDSALVIHHHVPGVLHDPQHLAWALEVAPLTEAKRRSDKIKESPYFYTLLDYELNCSFLTMESYIAAHHVEAKRKNEKLQHVEKAIKKSLKGKATIEKPVIHILPSTHDEGNTFIATGLKRFLKNKDLVMRFYGFKSITGNPVPEI